MSTSPPSVNGRTRDDSGRVVQKLWSLGRPDFWTTTNNKQLNFVQHVRSLFEMHGRAAVVVPDNVLFFDRKPHLLRAREMRCTSHAGHC